MKLSASCTLTPFAPDDCECKCCEVRQSKKYPAATDVPPHLRDKIKPDEWVPDIAASGGMGFRDNPRQASVQNPDGSPATNPDGTPKTMPLPEYFDDADGKMPNQAKGCFFKSHDIPRRPLSFNGTLKLKIEVIDTCNGNAVRDTGEVTLDFSKIKVE